MPGGPAYLGGTKPRSRLKLVVCALVTLAVVVAVVVVIYILPAVVTCGDPSGCRPAG